MITVKTGVIYRRRLVDLTKRWKRITEKLFRSRILKPLLIAITVKHIHFNVYTAHSMPHVMDLQHGFNLCGIDNLRDIEHAIPKAE
jgi:hypothetical protein